MHKIPIILESDIEVCRKIQAHFATNYYIATLAFPKETRLATFALYSFFRLPDEIVDSSHGDSIENITSALKGFATEWKNAYDTYPTLSTTTDERSAVLRASSYVFHAYNIPYKLSTDFLQAMEMDLTISRYKTRDDLLKYTYGSAAVVGLIMTYVMGYSSDEALPRATDLSNAMQITNFLRDVRSDYVERGRIYLPQEDLERHGLSYEDIARFSETKSIDARFVAYMKEEISKVRSLYLSAENDGIPLLNKPSRVPTLISLRLYRSILDEIEKMDYNVFAGRASVPKWKKLWIVLSSYFYGTLRKL